MGFFAPTNPRRRIITSSRCQPAPLSPTDPIIADLHTLIEIKLSSYLGSPASRLRDLADVNELIKLNQLPREFPLHSAVQPTFQHIWDALDAENRH